MKKLLITLALVSVLSSVFAQKKVSEGSVRFSVEYKLNEDQAIYAASLPAEVVVFFNGTMTKTETDQGTSIITVIADTKEKTNLSMIEIPIAERSFAIVGTKEDYQRVSKDMIHFSEYKSTGKKEKIAGFNAEEYSCQDQEGNAYTLWATKDIQLSVSNVIGVDFEGFEATPLRFSTIKSGIPITYAVEEIKEEKVGVLSLDVPEGFEVKSIQEIMQILGGM